MVNSKIIVDFLTFSKRPRVTNHVTVVRVLSDLIIPNSRPYFDRFTVSDFAIKLCHFDSVRSGLTGEAPLVLLVGGEVVTSRRLSRHRGSLTRSTGSRSGTCTGCSRCRRSRTGRCRHPGRYQQSSPAG